MGCACSADHAKGCLYLRPLSMLLLWPKSGEVLCLSEREADKLQQVCSCSLPSGTGVLSLEPQCISRIAKILRTQNHMHHPMC